jgi:hypothetical protein
MKTYETKTTPFGQEYILLTEEDGKVYSIPVDPANSDYQAYLNKDKPKVEHLTEIITPNQLEEQANDQSL